jgi:beta-glucanase (GH16 family)
MDGLVIIITHSFDGKAFIMQILRLSLAAPLLMATFMCCVSSESGSPDTTTGMQPPTDKNWSFETTPVWADEFDYSGKPDPAKWGYDTGGSGWGNHELEYYTDDVKNASASQGKLTITAIREKKGSNEYTSARLTSKNKGDFLYGRFEIKAQLPVGKGTWPAIWMLPTDNAYGSWPRSGEIDIMEHVGYDQNRVHITVHTQAFNHTIGTQVGKNSLVENASTAFHVYRVDWTPYAVRGYIDDQKLFEFVNSGKSTEEWPFDKRFHLLMNVAVGGDWGGSQGVDSNIWPQSMIVDYVRVYKMIDK